MTDRLTWLDWTLIAFGLLLLVHMPILILMDEGAEKYDSLQDSSGSMLTSESRTNRCIDERGWGYADQCTLEEMKRVMVSK